MIALDTNVLVRFLVEDDAAQSRRARRVVETAEAAGEALFVSDLVLCEMIWVLRYSYEVAKEEAVATLDRLLAAKQLAFDDSARLVRATTAYASGGGDFADYLIAEQAIEHGCTKVVTFDKKLLKEPRFVAP